MKVIPTYRYVDIINYIKYDLHRKHRAILDLIGSRFLTQLTFCNLGCPTVSGVFRGGDMGVRIVNTSHKHLVYIWFLLIY